MEVSRVMSIDCEHAVHSELIERYADELKQASMLGPVLDLACGCGRNGLYLARKGIPVVFADRDRDVHNLTTVMRDYRLLWMRRMLDRDIRMVDTQILGNLMRSMSFSASTTMFIIAGLVAVLGARDKAMAVLEELPFAVNSSAQLWDLKVLLLVSIFVYAFFKFTWAFRHYNYCLILVGAALAPA